LYYPQISGDIFKFSTCFLMISDGTQYKFSAIRAQ